VISLDLLDATSSLTASQLAWLSSYISRAADLLALSGTLNVRCIDDAEMTNAHAKFLDVPETTDVMTFDHAEDRKDLSQRLVWRVASLSDTRELPHVRTLDVSLLVCVDVARRQAKSRSQPVEHELLLYCIHGVLHCLGWDDEADEEFEAMHAFEDAILQKLGVGIVFARPDNEHEA
jgi:probable rRNA maturation factor